MDYFWIHYMNDMITITVITISGSSASQINSFIKVGKKMVFW